MVRYELVEGTSSKFWQYEVRDTALIVEYGRIGGKPQQTTKTFSSRDEAQRAADKLVREKTAKGYVAVDANEPAKNAPVKDPTPSAAPTSAPTTYRTLLKEIDLSKVRVRSGEETYGKGQWPYILWALIDAGLVKKTDAFAALGTLSKNAHLASPPALLWALSAMPSKVKDDAGVQLLNNYTLGMDALLMHLAHRAPEVLDQNEDKLPPNIRRAVPLVRKRLGATVEVDRALMDEFAASYARHERAWDPLVMLRNGELVNEDVRDWSTAQDLVRFYGDVEEWKSKARAAAVFEDGTFRYSPYYWSRTRALLVGAAVGDLGFLPDPHVRELLEQRSDSADDLVALLDAQGAEAESCRNIIAAEAAVRCRAEGKPVPQKVVAALTFDAPHGQAASYLETLRGLGKDAVAAKVAAFMKSGKAKDRDRAATGLAAVYDDASFRKLLAHEKLTDQDARALGLVGKAGLDALTEALGEANEREHEERFLEKARGYAAARAFEDEGFVAEGSPSPINVEQAALDVLVPSWPVERRHAWFEAVIDKRRPHHVFRRAELASDDTLDAAVLAELKEDYPNTEDLAAGGERVERALLRRLRQRKNDKKLLASLDDMPLLRASREEAYRIVLGEDAEAFVATPNAERAFADETTATLIAGKRVEGPYSQAGLVALCTKLDELAQRLKRHVSVAVGADLENTKEGEPVQAVIGIEIQRTEASEPQEIEAAVLDKALEDAKALPWDGIAEAMPVEWSSRDEQALYCVASGPLAVAKIATGKLVETEEEDDDALVYGTTMEQEQQSLGVRGKLVASCSYDSSAVSGLALPSLSQAAKKGAFLIASYDY